MNDQANTDLIPTPFLYMSCQLNLESKNIFEMIFLLRSDASHTAVVSPNHYKIILDLNINNLYSIFHLFASALCPWQDSW